MPLSDPDVTTLLRQAGKCLDVAEVTTFHCHRKRKDGSDATVIVQIFDRGRSAQGVPRYYATATDKETGKAASGNSGDSVRTVLATLHWSDLG